MSIIFWLVGFFLLSIICHAINESGKPEDSNYDPDSFNL
jgi:hypothetical protein